MPDYVKKGFFSVLTLITLILIPLKTSAEIIDIDPIQDAPVIYLDSNNPGEQYNSFYTWVYLDTEYANVELEIHRDEMCTDEDPRYASFAGIVQEENQVLLVSQFANDDTFNDGANGLGTYSIRAYNGDDLDDCFEFFIPVEYFGNEGTSTSTPATENHFGDMLFIATIAIFMSSIGMWMFVLSPIKRNG